MLKNKLNKPKVKLLTLWMLDKKYENAFRPNYGEKINDSVISNGIWQTMGVKEIDREGKMVRVYTLTCTSSYHPDLKNGTEIKMEEAMIIELCHRVKITHLAKYKSIIKKIK